MINLRKYAELSAKACPSMCPTILARLIEAASANSDLETLADSNAAGGANVANQRARAFCDSLHWRC
jgi:hypothetical protein